MRDITFTADLDNSEQRYIELPPPGINPAQLHHLLIALHGHGSDRWQFATDPRPECQATRDVAAHHGLLMVNPDYRATTS